MTLNEFVNKYNGKLIDYDGQNGGQCVDVFRQLCQEVFNIPHTGSCSTSGGAKDLFLDYNKMPLEKKYFKLIPKAVVFIPIWDKLKPCDVAVWDSTESNKYGHVAIVLGELGNDIIVFEQNGFKQDGCKINLRSKKNLLGVLRFNEC